MTPARLVAWSGAGVVLATVAAIAIAPPPDLSVRAPEALVELFSRERNAFLRSVYLAGLGWCGAFLVFVAALQHDLRARTDETTRLLASVGFAGGLAMSCAIGVFELLFALAAFRAEEGATARLLPLLTDAMGLANAATGFATAVCLAGFAPALRRTGLPVWLAVLGALVALHHLVSAAALATRGPFSPTSLLATTAPLAMTLWVGCVAALFWRRRERR